MTDESTEDKVKRMKESWLSLPPEKRREAQAIAIQKFGKPMPMDSTWKNRLKRLRRKVSGK